MMEWRIVCRTAFTSEGPLPPDNRTSVLLQQVDRWWHNPKRKQVLRKKKSLQVPGRSLASESDFIIKGIKNIFLRWLTLCSAVISGFRGRLPRERQSCCVMHAASQVRFISTEELAAFAFKVLWLSRSQSASFSWPQKCVGHVLRE